MNDAKVRESKSGHALGVEAEQLLLALQTMESQSDLVGKKLTPFEKADIHLPIKELTHLKESLKRLAASIGTFSSVTEKIAVAPEAIPEPVAEQGAGPKAVVTPEDTMFPQEGLTDATTGLPSRSLAEKTLESAVSVGRPRYAAVFALDRICHMASRYGPEVGTQALRHYALFLNQKLPSDSLLFRWRGAAYVCVFDNSGTAADAKLLMEQIAIQKVKFNFLTNHRSAMVNLTASFLTIPISDHATVESLTRQVDQFIEAHSARQPH